MRVLIFLVLLAAAALADRHQIYVELHEDGDLVGTAQIGTLSWRSTVIFDLSRSDIVLRGEIVNISRTWNPVASRENLALGNAPSAYLPVADGNTADYERMQRRGADAIVGLAFGTPLGWHWRCVSLSATTITLSEDACPKPPVAYCTYAAGGTCVVEGTRLFAPGGTFYAPKEVVEAAVWSWDDILIGPFVIGGHSYQKTGVEKAVQYLAIGEPALSALALRTTRFQFYLDRGGVSWRRVRGNVVLPPSGHVLSLVLLVAWAVYCSGQSKETSDSTGIVALFEGPPAQHAAAVLVGSVGIVSIVLTYDVLSDVLGDGQGVIPVLCMMHAATGLIGALAMTRSVVRDYVVETAAWASIVLLVLYETDGAWALIRYSVPAVGFLAIYIRCVIRYAREYVSKEDWYSFVPLGVFAVVGVVHAVYISVYCFSPVLVYYQSFDSGTRAVFLLLAFGVGGLAVYSHSNT